jgi:S-(hydroxymethyl)glutathione dehydrogenase / alcohol dehydrogenase
MKALVLNAVGRGFDFENVDIAPPIGREVLVDVRVWAVSHRPYKEKPDDSNHG